MMQQPTAPIVEDTAPVKMVQNAHLKTNMFIVTYNRIFAAIVGGIFTGVLGVTGYKGFGFYLLFQLLATVVLLAKSGFQWQRYFLSSSTVFVSGILSQTEFLTFVLLWTLSNNLVYLF